MRARRKRIIANPPTVHTDTIVVSTTYGRVARAAAGALIVLVSRLLSFPRTPWEYDEFLFLEAVRHFAPLQHHPHPPGYPLFVGLGKAAAAIVGDPFAGLVALNILAAVIGFVALYYAFCNYVGDDDVAAAGALMFFLSAGMLVHSSLALADTTSIMFVAITFCALSGEPSDWRAGIAGAAAAAAIGCRPQSAVPMLPALFLGFLWMRTVRQRQLLAALFMIVSFSWLVPLLVATRGWRGFLVYQLDQMKYVAAHDAAESRGAKTLLRLAARFALRAWGSTLTIAMIGALSIIGVLPFIRRVKRNVIPFIVCCAIKFVFVVLTMDSADAVRYSFPALPIVALIAACAFMRTQSHALPWAGTLVFALFSAWYVGPILVARTNGPSPIVAAARYIETTFPPNTVVLVQGITRPHVEYLLPRFHQGLLDEGLRALYNHPEVPVVLVADGKIDDADAKAFRWRPSESYTKMTRNFGRVVTVDVLRPEQRFLRVDGVYPLETNADVAAWRWLAPTASLRVPALGKQSVVMTFKLSNDAPFEDNELTISIDGHESVHVTVRKTPSSVTLALPSTDALITIHAARSFRPSETLGNGDARVLAAQLIGLEQK